MYKDLISRLKCFGNSGIPIAKEAAEAIEDLLERYNEAVDVPKALDYIKSYSFVDYKEEYTNGATLVSLFRVRRALEDKAYNGFMEG